MRLWISALIIVTPAAASGGVGAGGVARLEGAPESRLAKNQAPGAAGRF